MGVSQQQSEVEASIDMVHPIPKGERILVFTLMPIRTSSAHHFPITL
jgi:hypothetical protein